MWKRVRKAFTSVLWSLALMRSATAVPNTDNAIVVHDPALVLCLGLVHTFDKTHGNGWKM
eukprot:868251-Prymnesium_polylepis.2